MVLSMLVSRAIQHCVVRNTMNLSSTHNYRYMLKSTHEDPLKKPKNKQLHSAVNEWWIDLFFFPRASVISPISRLSVDKDNKNCSIICKITLINTVSLCTMYKCTLFIIFSSILLEIFLYIIVCLSSYIFLLFFFFYCLLLLQDSKFPPVGLIKVILFHFMRQWISV